MAALVSLINYLPFGVLFPRPPPDGLPVVLGPFGGRGADPLAISLLLGNHHYLGYVRRTNRPCRHHYLGYLHRTISLALHQP